MKRVLILTLCAMLFASCDKEGKETLARLQSEMEELKAESVGSLPSADPVDGPHDVAISFDKDIYWVDAAGSITAHYTLEQAADIEVSSQSGWSAVVNKSSDTEGYIVITAPDPASPGIIEVRATDAKGNTAEAIIETMVRMPCTDATRPIYKVLAYNGFNDDQATLENFKKMMDAGVNMITVEGEDLVYGPGWRNQCRVAEQAGAKVILFIGYTHERYYLDPEHFTGLDDLINEAAQYPAICAYQIADEPSTAKVYHLAFVKDKIESLAPDRPVYINLHPSTVSQGGMGALTYEEYVEYFASMCDLQFITFDQYPIWKTGVEDSWYRSLNVVYDTAKRHGIPFWAFIQTCREYSRVDPTVETIRLQGNVNLAYGAQCNQLFVWKATSGTNYAPILQDGTWTQAYDDCKTYCTELHNREYVFVDCDVRSVRHTGYDYYRHGTCLTAADYPEAISDISVAGSAVVSFIGNNGNEYVTICNKSYENKISAKVTFTREVYTIDRNGVFTLREPGEHQFTLDEADMLVIKWR